MLILGISCDYHDAAAALVESGSVLAAAEEERFTRVKHDASMPTGAVASCLAQSGRSIDDIDVVVFHEKPLSGVERMLATRRSQGPRAFFRFVTDMPATFRTNLMVEHRIGSMFLDLGASRIPPVRFGEHHTSHAAAAFLPSPFADAAILTVDGLGESTTVSIGLGSAHRVELLEELRFPDSLGLFYSLITAWCGFEPNDGEYKVMGLAPSGHPRFRSAMDELFRVAPDGSFQVDQRGVGLWSTSALRSRRLRRLLGGPPRPPGSPLTQREADLARSVQDLTEDVMIALAERAHRITGQRNLCIAGGVALNCVANSRIRDDGPFDHMWIQPAAGDSGSALGAALWWWHCVEHNHRTPTDSSDPVSDGMRGAALGPEFSDDEIAAMLHTMEQRGVTTVGRGRRRAHLVADLLAEGNVIGWFDGRMEFGPRALGHRSILADPRRADMQSHLNQKIKGRESFRPFAPAVLWEHASEWYEISEPSPYMLFTHRVAGRGLTTGHTLPACTHVDGSARVQTVHRETNPDFHLLLSTWNELTGCPVLLNTSFNIAGQPIVCTPREAVLTARRANLDALVLGGHVVDLRSAEGSTT